MSTMSISPRIPDTNVVHQVFENVMQYVTDPYDKLAICGVAPSLRDKAGVVPDIETWQGGTSARAQHVVSLIEAGGLVGGNLVWVQLHQWNSDTLTILSQHCPKLRKAVLWPTWLQGPGMGGYRADNIPSTLRTLVIGNVRKLGELPHGLRSLVARGSSLGEHVLPSEHSLPPGLTRLHLEGFRGVCLPPPSPNATAALVDLALVNVCLAAPPPPDVMRGTTGLTWIDVHAPLGCEAPALPDCLVALATAGDTTGNRFLRDLVAQTSLRQLQVHGSRAPVVTRVVTTAACERLTLVDLPASAVLLLPAARQQSDTVGLELVVVVAEWVSLLVADTIRTHLVKLTLAGVVCGAGPAARTSLGSSVRHLVVLDSGSLRAVTELLCPPDPKTTALRLGSGVQCLSPEWLRGTWLQLVVHHARRATVVEEGGATQLARRCKRTDTEPLWHGGCRPMARLVRPATCDVRLSSEEGCAEFVRCAGSHRLAAEGAGGEALVIGLYGEHAPKALVALATRAARQLQLVPRLHDDECSTAMAAADLARLPPECLGLARHAEVVVQGAAWAEVVVALSTLAAGARAAERVLLIGEPGGDDGCHAPTPPCAGKMWEWPRGLSFQVDSLQVASFLRAWTKGGHPDIV